MPRNRKRNRQQFRTLTSIQESTYIPDQRRLYNKTNNNCQRCGRNLEFYPYSADQLCQICRRDNIKWRNEFQPAEAQNYFPPRPDPANNSFQNNEILQFRGNDQFFNQEKYTYPDTWQRRIYFKDARKPSDSFNSYDNSQEFQNQSQFLQRTISYRPHNNAQVPLPLYQNNSQHQFSNIPSTSYSIPNKGDYKRKRELEEDSSKRIKAAHYSSSQLCSYNQLNTNIMEYFKQNIQTGEIFNKKMALRSRLQQLIQKKFFGCSVYVFGSSMTGFATKASDADMCLYFHDMKIVKNRIVRILWDIRTLFSRHYNFTKMQVIRAKVPIIKFLDTLSGFEVDLNINNPTGIRNSQLLRSYGRLDNRVQPLILAIKFWAREHNINDAKNGTLSSYCLGLMLIHYLQCGCNPPVLPSLQVMQPDKYSPNSDISSLGLDEVLPNFISANNETVAQLFVGFLGYYSKQYNYEQSRISIRLGRLLPRVDKMLTKENELRHWIDIEEPFEQVNTAHAVCNDKKAAFIKSVFDNSFNSVIQKGAVGLL